MTSEPQIYKIVQNSTKNWILVLVLVLVLGLGLASMKDAIKNKGLFDLLNRGMTLQYY
jgi:hypothetical protein